MKIHAILVFVSKIVMPALVLSACVVFAVAPLSCKVRAEGISLLSEGCSAPALVDFSVCGSDSLSLSFDRDVRVLHALVSAADGDCIDVSVPSAGGRDAVLALSPRTKLGVAYTLTGDVLDEEGNTLTFGIAFSGYNDAMPRLLLAEVRNAYASKKNHYEFVRLLCVTGGNLAGYELLSAGDGEQKKYVFPPIEVAAGDFITVHLRMMKDSDGAYCQEGMVDEVRGDRNASFAADSSADAWDLWVDNQKSRLAPSDILVLRNAATGAVVDALPFVDPKKQEAAWNKGYEALCRAVEESGVWCNADGEASCAVADAVQAEGITSSATSRTLCRKDMERAVGEGGKNISSASDWYVKNYARRR